MNRKKLKVEGIIPALATPMNDDESLNENGIGSEIELNNTQKKFKIMVSKWHIQIVSITICAIMTL